MIEHQLDAGLWVAVQRGVYRSAFAPTCWQAELTAAHLGTPGSTVSHESSAELRGLRSVPQGRLVLTVIRHDHHTDRLARIHESTDLAPTHVEQVGGLRVTTVARTVIDLAAVLPRGRLARVIDEVLTGRRVEHGELCALHASLRRRGKRGFVKLGELLEERGDGMAMAESELEARFHELIWRAGLLAPTTQVAVPWRSASIGRVDAAYVEARLIIELDGRRWHSRDADHDRDRRRDNEALCHGWRVLRFTWQQVVHDPAYVVATLRAALGSLV